MFIQNWKKELTAIPNLLTLFRLVLIPVYVTLYLMATCSADYHLAGLILALSCLTDLLDGKVARHFNMVTNLGKLLDPLADKATQLALTLCLSIRYPVLRPVLVLFLIKESFQTAAAAYYLRRGMVLSGALTVGKVCTTIMFASLTALVFFPRLPAQFISIIAMADLAALAVSFLCYGLAFFGKRRNTHLQDLS